MKEKEEFNLTQAVIEESARSVDPATIAAAVAARVPKASLIAVLEEALVLYVGWALRTRRATVWGSSAEVEDVATEGTAEAPYTAARPSKYQRWNVTPSRWLEILAQPIYGVAGNVRLADATLDDVAHARDWHARQSEALASRARLYGAIADAMAASGAKTAADLQENVLMGIVVTAGEKVAAAA